MATSLFAPDCRLPVTSICCNALSSYTALLLVNASMTNSSSVRNAGYNYCWVFIHWDCIRQCFSHCTWMYMMFLSYQRGIGWSYPLLHLWWSRWLIHQRTRKSILRVGNLHWSWLLWHLSWYVYLVVSRDLIFSWGTTVCTITADISISRSVMSSLRSGLVGMVYWYAYCLLGCFATRMTLQRLSPFFADTSSLAFIAWSFQTDHFVSDTVYDFTSPHMQYSVTWVFHTMDGVWRSLYMLRIDFNVACIMLGNCSKHQYNYHFSITASVYWCTSVGCRCKDKYIYNIGIKLNTL